MAIVINGSGTLTGLAVGGLPDDTVDAGTLANSINTEITTNTAKTGISSAQTSAITANTAKTGITSSQATAITAALPKAGGNMTGPINITANTTAMTFNTPSSGQNSWITWKDNGAAKWEMNKNIANNFNIYSYALGANSLSLLPDGRGLSQFTAKAWVNFNGTGTPAIRDSHNVSSITDNGSGNYSTNYSTNMTNVNYSVQVSSNGGGGNAYAGSWGDTDMTCPAVFNMTVSKYQQVSYELGVGYFDCNLLMGIVFGD